MKKHLHLTSILRVFAVLVAVVLSATAFAQGVAEGENGAVEEYSITYTSFQQDGNMYIMKADGFGDGLYAESVQGYLQIESQDRFYRLHSVQVTCGVSERQSTEGISSSVIMSVNGHQQEIGVQSYMQPSAIEMETYTFAIEKDNEDAGAYIDFEIQGLVGVKVESVTVYFEKDESITEYPIWIRTYDSDLRDYVDIQVTSANRLDILENGGKVQFDGNNMLVLNGASFAGITTEIENTLLYLKGTNKIDAGSNTPVSFRDILTVTTEGNNPGSLQLSVYSPSLPFGTENVIFEQNLVYQPPTSYGSVRTGYILVPVNPIVNISDTEKEQPVTTNSNLDNKVYNDVLYTLKSDEGSYDPTTQSIQMATTMFGEDIDAIITDYQPGTYGFAENFAGITFLVPAGTGKAIVTGMTGEAGELNVKIGHNAPNIIPSGVMTMTRYEFPYDCEQATFVYVYSNSPVVTTSAIGDRRAGKKTTVTVGVGSVGVGASVVHNSNPNNGIVTAIKTIVNDEQRVVRSNNGWYTISGHRLQNMPTQKGLYIFNGRKFVIK